MSEPLPDIRTAPPVAQAEAQALRAKLDAEIPAKRLVDRNLLIATWNIRMFSRLTEKWLAGDGDSPKRCWRSLHSIAQIISRFDVVAVQEIMGDLQALRTLIKTLGDGWGFLITDENRNAGGPQERMGFLFDASRVRLSGLAGELAAPADEEVLRALSPEHPFRGFVRTPYAVSFQAGRDSFVLVTAHVLYGAGAADRTGELSAIGRWMADWADDMSRWHHNLLVLGDFNIDRAGDANYEAFTGAGLVVPEQLRDVPRMAGTAKHYDQIAWFADGARRKLSMELISAGSFDFSDVLFRAEPALDHGDRSWRISDHLPLWADFRGTPRG
ncbi:MAG: endonuclease/exonuclease/phosphatase family protein [Pseudomonadota bacterium]